MGKLKIIFSMIFGPIELNWYWTVQSPHPDVISSSKYTLIGLAKSRDLQHRILLVGTLVC